MIIENVEKSAVLFQEKHKWVVFLPYHNKKFISKKKKNSIRKANNFKNNLVIIELDKETHKSMKNYGRYVYCVFLGFLLSGGCYNWKQERI